MQHILDWLTRLAEHTNVAVFSVVGSFLEEVIAPIPSPFVLTTTGVLAEAHHFTLLQILGVLVLVSLAKTFASWILYVLADKSEDFLFKKFGRFMPIEHKQIEKIGSYLTGTWWDDILLFVARALPVVPSLPISVAAGVIKYELKSYLLMTFLGSLLRSGFYVWLGYVGTEQAAVLWRLLENNPVLLTICTVVVLVVLIAIARLKDFLWGKVLQK